MTGCATGGHIASILQGTVTPVNASGQFHTIIGKISNLKEFNAYKGLVHIVGMETNYLVSELIDLTLKTADMKNNGSKMNTTPERSTCTFSSVTGSLFQDIKEQPATN